MRAEFFHSDGQIDMTKLVVAFFHYAKMANNAPINYTFLTVTGTCPARRTLLIKYLKPSDYSPYRYHHF